ncbi:MarR family winged helix-turn-helix transcriptional regulator [Bacillus sp. T3]|uniref:MarR family winged helix-turn-helix transcriptional regulator n=1 Tax=Bacillus sp. T3 TaxID=467262 RepID=UPI0029817C0A|nr:MarR family transcriptional regulator [Bacillus sp. T3]
MVQKVFFEKFIAFSASVHRLTYELTKNCKSDEITPIQYSMLEHLAVSEPMTLSEISECHHMSLPNTSREIKKLTLKNLIRKLDDKEDRRKQYITLSEDGVLMMKETFQCAEAHLLQRIKGLSAEELKDIQQAIDLLQKKIFY